MNGLRRVLSGAALEAGGAWKHGHPFIRWEGRLEPRIEDRNAQILEILYIPGDKGEVMF